MTFPSELFFECESDPMTILPDLSDLVIEQVSVTHDVTIRVHAASLTAPCPCCGTISKRVQSRYTRTLRDLPASGRSVHLVVQVRRFFCQENSCISKGAPQAIQVADLWHVAKNLSESMQTLLARCRAEIRRGLYLQALPEQGSEETEPVLEEEKRPARSRSVQLAQEGRRAQKQGQYQQVVDLHQQEVKAAEIASRVGIGARTVHRWLAHSSFPEARQRRRCPSLIDPYERYVITRWQEGYRNGTQLYRELAAQGYKGSPKAMYNYLATLRTSQSDAPRPLPSKPQGQKSAPLAPILLKNFSARRATWLFIHQPEKLDETQHQELALMRQASPSTEAAYGLAQAFMHMIREHTGQQLETWLRLVEESTLPEFKSFAKGIRQDKAAVFAGLTLPWSNGPLEGHVNRLKLMKRSMYGRAKLPLLRRRVLHSSFNKSLSTATRAA